MPKVELREGYNLLNVHGMPHIVWKVSIYYLIEILITALRGCYWHHSESYKKTVHQIKIIWRGFIWKGSIYKDVARYKRASEGSVVPWGQYQQTCYPSLGQRNEHRQQLPDLRRRKACFEWSQGLWGEAQPTQGDLFELEQREWLAGLHTPLLIPARDPYWPEARGAENLLV